MMHRNALLAGALAAALAAGCSSGLGDDLGTPTTPTPPPTAGPPADPATVITVSAAGVSPSEIAIPIGSRVTFSNVDSRPHDFAGGPDPSRPECPEIDAAGFVAAGQSRQSNVFTTAKTCRYHDHAYIGVPAFEGRIVVR
jgi:plastocyanin